MALKQRKTFWCPRNTNRQRDGWQGARGYSMLDETHRWWITNNLRYLLTCADDGGRIITVRRTCRMAFGGHVYGYLNTIQCWRWARWGARPLGLRGHGIARLRTPMYPKMTSAALNGKKEMKWASYTSEGPKAKSTRERCIRVAAIISMISLGASNNCDAARNEKLGSSHRESQNLRYVTDLIFKIKSSSTVRYHI